MHLDSPRMYRWLALEEFPAKPYSECASDEGAHGRLVSSRASAHRAGGVHRGARVGRPLACMRLSRLPCLSPNVVDCAGVARRMEHLGETSTATNVYGVNRAHPGHGSHVHSPHCRLYFWRAPIPLDTAL